MSKPLALTSPEDRALAECKAASKSIGKKADKNKRRSRFLIFSMTASTALIPLLIGLGGNDFFLGKVAPSVLAAASAVLATVNQLERPHERWVLYRRYERLLQAEAKRYSHELDPYQGRRSSKRLASRVAQLELDLQEEWEGLIPRRTEIEASTGSNK